MGSELGNGYSWKGLQSKGVTFEQARDRTSLERFSTGARSVAGNQAQSGDEPGDGSDKSDSRPPQVGQPERLCGREAKAVSVRIVLIPDHKQKIKAWREQAAALGAPTYRVTLGGRTRTAENKRINWGKSRDEGTAEQFCDANGVADLIPQVRRRNLLGFNV